MQFSIFTDEIDPDSPERAVRLATKWAVAHVEIRVLPQGRFPAVPDDQLDGLCALIDEAGLSVSGVSPGFCKCPWDDPSVTHVLVEHLPRACELARRLKTDLVSCFAFSRNAPGPVPSAVIDLVGELSVITRQHGCRLVLENEAGCWGATGLEAASIIRQVGSRNIGLCWDPGNSCLAGSARPYPDEYFQIKDLVSHVHMKNIEPLTDSWCLMDKGMVDWRGQLAALSADGYTGFLVVETHLHARQDGSIVDKKLSDLENNTLHNLTFVRSCLGEIKT